MINLVKNYLLKNRRDNVLLKYTSITEYIEDIYINLKDEERTILLKENINYKIGDIADNYKGYMSSQKEINEKMRAILIDWLVATLFKFKLRTRILFLSVSIIDRYLTKEIINRVKLQLLGVTSLFIACKHEQTKTPPGIEFADSTDYTKEEILNMEYQILKTLNFEIMTPTPIQFYEIICVVLNFSSKEILLGRYWMESFMIQYKSTFYSSSLIATSAAYLVFKYFSLRNYRIIFCEFFNSNNSYNKLKECAKEIVNSEEANRISNLLAVNNKFGQRDE